MTDLTIQTPHPNDNTPSSPKINETLAAQIAEKIKANSLNGQTDDLTSFETKRKVDNVKQKVYVFALAVAIYFVYSYAKSALDVYNENLNIITQKQGEITSLDNQINGFETNKNTLQLISSGSDNMKMLVTCINNPNLCDKILTGLKSNIPVIRSYLLVTPLSGQKMEIDQKTILRYFNEYIVDKNDGVQLLNIAFTAPSIVNEERNIHLIGVETTFTFPDKPSMMKVIEKVERGLDPNYQLLVKIKSINYDIVKYLEPQTVNISFEVYHYK